MSVERGQTEDGAAFVRIEISSLAEDSSDDEGSATGPGPLAQHEEEEEGEGEAEEEGEADDGIRTIDDLAASVGMGGEGEGGEGVSQEEAEELAAWQAAADMAGPSGRTLKEEVDALTDALMQSAAASSDPSSGARRGATAGRGLLAACCGVHLAAPAAAL